MSRLAVSLGAWRPRNGEGLCALGLDGREETGTPGAVEFHIRSGLSEHRVISQPYGASDLVHLTN